MRPGEYRQNRRKGNQRIISACEMASRIEDVHLAAGINALHLRIFRQLTQVVGVDELQASRGMKAIEQKAASLANVALSIEEDDVWAIDHLHQLYRTRRRLLSKAVEDAAVLAGSVQTPIVICMGLQWDFGTLADELEKVVGQAEAELRLEQAVYGLDSRSELQIQELLAQGLKQFYEVAREVHYPSTAGKKLSHRKRCDLVLTPKGRPLKLDSVLPSLFDPVDQAEPHEGLWLEVKVAYQFREGNIRHGGYGAQWRDGVVEDLRKMEAEPLIHEAGLCLMVFTESREILEKDIELFESILTRKEVLAGFRKVRTVEITERIGHRNCTVALWPTIQR
jgi:hypothetical protein